MRVTPKVRAVVGTVALLAVIMPSGAALAHGAAHHQGAQQDGSARHGVLLLAAGAHEGSNAEQHAPDAGRTVKSDATGSHLVLHARTVASFKGRFSPALPAELRQPRIASPAEQVTVTIGVVPDYLAPSHSLAPDQPRAPPLA